MKTNETLLLRSPLLRLHRLENEDATAIQAYRSLPEVAHYQSWDSYTMDDAERLVAEQKAVVPDTPGQWLQLAIALAATGELIGDCGFHFLSDGQQVELGITLSPAHQGQGLACEALESVLGYVFGTLNKHRAIAITNAENLASARLLERVGFRREAHGIENVWFKGAWGSEYQFALLGREWLTRPDCTASR